MNRRMEQVNELIAQELSKIIQRETSEDNQGAMLTVQEVQTTADLKTAKVWISIFGSSLTDELKNKLIENLQQKSFEFQKRLSGRLKLKFIPKLTFKLDASGEVVQKIDQAIEGIKNK